MEARFGSEVGKRSLEWDLNDWRWDGDLFVASRLNSASSQLFPVREEFQVAGILSNSSSSCSDEIDAGKGKKELEKRRRVVVCEEEELVDGVEQSRILSLKLGEQVYPIGGGSNGKKSKMSVGASSNRGACQVENCVADLSLAKDYHRRHKVCEMHSKASKAIVGNVMQRFCQQCSRFHVLQEFDEGKRSCRRRLAGHNRRRRKTHPEAAVNGASLNNDQSSNYVLISLLRILANIQSKGSDQGNDQDLLSHLLRNLAGYAGTTEVQNDSGSNQERKEVINVEAIPEASSIPRLVSNGHKASRLLGSTSQTIDVVDTDGPQIMTVNPNTNSATASSEKGIIPNIYPDGVRQSLPFQTKDTPSSNAFTSDSTVRRTKINNFDLNSVYSDSQDYEGLENSQIHATLGGDSHTVPLWMRKDSQQSSPPQTSLNSDSLSGQSRSSSGGDAQNRTDRIVFKLFGKDPNDFPVGFRSQILNWLSYSPADIESYIRPGCIILTIYLHLPESKWHELQYDLSSSLNKLLDVSDDAFWRTGWVYIRAQHRISFIYNGQIVLDTSLPFTSNNHSQITSVTPIAVSVSGKARFLVRGYNLSRPTARLLCALEGNYLLQEAASDLLDTSASDEHNEIQCLSFACSVPDVIGRGFLEVEDHGLSSGFFPFIVAEQNVCLEICTLESAIEVTDFNTDIPESADKMGAKNQALEFIHEMGWLLRRSHLRSRLGHMDSRSDLFSFGRFRWLMEFSLDHDWCAVVKKLLDVFFDGNVDPGEYFSVELALLEINLLHRAVRKRCLRMVQLLLNYAPENASDIVASAPHQPVRNGSDWFLFKPDAVGPAGLTPLHIAACSDGSENLLDALTDDPGLVGIEAWKTVRDNAGLTPEDYARLRGHFTYIHLVHKKNNKRGPSEHVILDIPNVHLDYDSNSKKLDGSSSRKFTGFQLDRMVMKSMNIEQNCRICDQQVAYGNTRRSLVYRPAMLSLLAIAAVCVCASLFFKSSPEVLFVYPFRWELLEFGSF